MASGNMADGVGHGQHRQAESQGYAEQPDSHLRERCRDHGASTATEGQPERAYRLGRKTLSVHGNPPAESTTAPLHRSTILLQSHMGFKRVLLTHCTPMEPLRRQGGPSGLKMAVIGVSAS